MDAAQADKLREKYNQLKQANKVLKEGLLDKQAECERVGQQLKDKEATLRQQMEEIDHLQFQNGRMSKQLGTLTAQLEEQKQRHQPGGWSVQGLISGKQQQEAIQKAEDEIRVLQSELMSKIQENEELHMRLFELQKQHEEEQQRLREATAAIERELDARTGELEAERERSAALLDTSQGLSSRVDQLTSESAAAAALAESMREALEAARLDAAGRIRGLESQLARWVPFDEAEHEPWAIWNVSSRQGRTAERRHEAVRQLQAAASEVCRQSCGILQLWAKTFGGGNDQESAKRLQVRTKMSETVQRVAKMLGEQIPTLVSSMDLVQMMPTPSWGREYRSSVAVLLQAHRKWVVYQSLLLLHDWNSAYASRSAQEEAQAQRFVEWLWRLHRCVRALLWRVGAAACLPGVATSGRSAAHFELARGALRRYRGEGGGGGGGGAGSRGGSPPRVSEPRSPPRRASSGAAAAGSPLAAEGRGGSGPSVDPLVAAASADAVATRLVESLRRGLQDVAQCWEGIGRCLSAWATAQAKPSSAGDPTPNGGGSVVVELLEALHRFSACLADRAVPALAELARRTPCPPCRASSSSSGAPAPLRVADSYLGRAAARLARAPGALGFDEAVQTQALSRRLAAAGARLSKEVRQQVRRLQAVTDEKAVLADELRALQDNFALLSSNYQVLQEQRGAAPASGASAAAAAAAAGGVAAAAAERGVSLGAPADLVLSSRQRALLESLSVTAQESSALRQHGFFVDVISLAPSEAALASGPPDGDPADSGAAPTSWEVAVRKVYEQHARQLQAQIRAADGKAMHLHLAVQQHLDVLRQQEAAQRRLRDEAEAARGQLRAVEEDMATTRKNYDNQLAMLTEHICTLSVRLSDKDASLASLQAQKVLCGRCGMWNTMGKLLAAEAEGACQTCKEKVLTRS